MQITSTAFEQGGSIPAKYTVDGGAVNPPLTFSDVPDGAVSLSLIMEDPDVPSHIREDNMFDHWVIWNMPADTQGIAEASKPNGIEGLNTAGDNEYRRPAPPDGEHRYFFYLYALDIELDLPEASSKADLLAAMEGHIIEKADLLGRYKPNL